MKENLRHLYVDEGVVSNRMTGEACRIFNSSAIPMPVDWFRCACSNEVCSYNRDTVAYCAVCKTYVGVPRESSNR